MLPSRTPTRTSLIYKNSGGTNQAIFGEAARGGSSAATGSNREVYVRNSPVNFAKNVKMLLIILHNDKLGAVDFTQGVEYLQHAPAAPGRT